MGNQQKIIVLVSTDLSTDQRVRKMCNSLINLGYSIELVGRKLPDSKKLNLPFKTRRFKLWFNKGLLFYANLNIRLFFFLLFSKFDRIQANDLDTLMPAYLVSKLRNKHLVYDTHEIFTEVTEIQGRWVRRIWVLIENSIFPKVKNVITVNQSIAHFYQQKFNRNDIVVIRNIPDKKALIKTKTRKDLNLPIDRFILIVQGSGINIDRGIEEVLLSLKKLNGVLLLIVGSGDAIPGLKEMTIQEQVSDKVKFVPRLPYEQMMQYTMNADLGLSVDKPTSLNYEFSLPNKIFDYIRAGIPILASNLVEVAALVKMYDIGTIIGNVNPTEITRAIQKYQKNTANKEQLITSLNRASRELIWENDAKALEIIYK